MKLVTTATSYSDYLLVRQWLKQLVGEEPIRFLKDKSKGTYSLYTTAAGERKVLRGLNSSSQDRLAV